MALFRPGSIVAVDIGFDSGNFCNYTVPVSGKPTRIPEAAYLSFATLAKNALAFSCAFWRAASVRKP
jgi:hypothetical protein